MPISNYEGIQIIVRPVLDGTTYEFIVTNHGDLTLWNLLFSTYEILSPGAFGLDDTYMPDSLTNEEPAQIPCLPSGGSVSFFRTKWGTMDRYSGLNTGTTLIKFAPRENEERCFALRATFTVTRVPSPGALQRLSPFAERNPRSYRFGKAFANLVNKCRLKRASKR